MIKTVHIVNHTHTDIGYTDLAHRVKVDQTRHLDMAMELCEKTANKKNGESFCWTIESLWALKEYLKRADAARIKKLLKLMKAGLIELTGFFHQPLTQLMNIEDLMEELAYGINFARSHKLKLDTLMLNDIGGLSWNMPQIMRKAGIKYFILGTGGWRVMTPIAGLPHMFYYCGPDASRILMYHLGLGRNLDLLKIDQLYAQYGFGATYLLFPFRKKMVSDGEKADTGASGDAPLYELIRRIENEGYAYDTLLLQCGMDNKGPQKDILEVVSGWNKRHADVKLRLGTAGEFFRYIEKKYGSKIPLLNGELTCSWSEHVLTQGKGCGLVKEADSNLYIADTNSLLPFCNDEKLKKDFISRRRDIVSGRLLFKDHTFGLTMWGWEHAQEKTGRLHLNGSCHDYARDSWDTKYSHAYSAWLNSKTLKNDYENLIAIRNEKGNHVSFYNPLPFARGGLTRFFARDLGELALVSENEQIIPDRDPLNDTYSEYSLYLPAIDAFSFKTYRIESHVKLKKKSAFRVNEDAQKLTVISKKIALSVSKKNGSIISWTHAGKELVDRDAECGLNDFSVYSVKNVLRTPLYMGLHDNPVFTRRKIRQTDVAVTLLGSHVLKIQIIRLIGGSDKTIRIETEIALSDRESRVYLKNRVRKINLAEKEAAYFVFPFNVSKDWKLYTKQQGYVHEFLKERLPGSAHQNIGFQDYAILEDGNKAFLLTSLHSAIMSIGKAKYYNSEIEYKKDKKGWLYMYCFNNLWGTNCALEQFGDMDFDFAIEPVSTAEIKRGPGLMDRRSKEVKIPIIGYTGIKIKKTNPLISIDNPFVECSFIQPEENAGRLKLLLVNLSRKEQKASITLDVREKAIKKIAFAPAEFKVISI